MFHCIRMRLLHLDRVYGGTESLTWTHDALQGRSSHDNVCVRIGLRELLAILTAA